MYMAVGLAGKVSRRVYSPSAVSSFFEVCDRDNTGVKIADPLRIGSRGGGFKLKKGTYTLAFEVPDGSDTVLINGVQTQARTTKRVIDNLRRIYGFGPVRIEHTVELPVGSGFGTSGAGALTTAIAISDLFGLNLTLSQAADHAHRAEVESVTGLGTVTALAYGGGAMGLVTEPGGFSLGRVDAILKDYSEYVIVCAWFGPIEKSTVLLSEDKLTLVNTHGREAMQRIMEERTPEALLRYSRVFAEKSGIATPEHLKLADAAARRGAVGATQNMIGNAVHCLVEKPKLDSFVTWIRGAVGGGEVIISELSDSGPRLLSSP
ncbi:hypothetical protein B9Q04_03600 [Candidatus Marsarchaeota G2 archaeon BE_D]|jgi:Predicted archaeal kinase (sugar kinase superfamily)|uniref:Pantoate kinase n=1 Tax=Candidatus Marsarchaeota G2 archaeon BE_D TaxID=1978158 RepID=A0A2R6CD55_9ARCH|nr:MAG: hypothetical protein B9Q04_03600 [Candidatus Marsarchaeota G2 archaeon BE_D]